MKRGAGGSSSSEGRSLPYWVWFGALSAVSLAVLLAIVFAVFPQRFVLTPGLREQGLNFPAEAPGFELPASTDFLRPPPPEEEPATGPAERLWSRVTALVEMGRDELAIREMRAWLDDRPGDHDVRLEYARALERTSRLPEAKAAYARVLAARGDDAARDTRLSLARLRWRTGDLEGALALYDELVAQRPGDRAVRRERADLLFIVDRPREAADAYRALLAEAPEGAASDELRVALARALQAAGATVAAWRAASAVPPESPEADEASELRGTLRGAMPLPAADPVAGAPLARARAAAGAGELERAERLYRTAVFLGPDDETPRLELAELLATRRDVPAEAVAVLESLGRRASRRGADAAPFAATDARPSVELRRRLARYRLWSGDDAGALALLNELAGEGEATADDLALAADILRWRGRRPQAEARYVDALAREVDHDRARKGRELLRRETREAVETRDPVSAGVESDLYVDSDDFRSWGVAGRAVLDPGWDAHRLVARTGVRSVRGTAADGSLEEEAGPEGHVGWVGWWRQATLRTEVRVGAERLESTGTEPVVGAELAVPRLGLEAAYRHGLAHPTTLTLASVRDETRIDAFEASLFRPLVGGWGLWTAVEGASVRGGGVDNGRFVAQATLDRPVALGGRFRAGYATRMLTTTDPAPLTAFGADAYWSPALSWTHGLSLQVERPRDETGWGWSVRAQPGASVVRLHGDDEPTELEFAFFGEGGLEYRAGDASVRLGAEYVRSRVDGFEALGTSLGVTWRF